MPKEFAIFIMPSILCKFFNPAKSKFDNSAGKRFFNPSSSPCNSDLASLIAPVTESNALSAPAVTLANPACSGFASLSADSSSSNDSGFSDSGVY